MVRDISNTPIKVIEQMSDDDLRLLMKEDMDMGLGMVIIREMSARELKLLSKPHWSVTPNFWLTLIAAAAAVLGLFWQPSQSPVPLSASTLPVAHPTSASSPLTKQGLPPSPTNKAKK
jgi:hypothetical protein